MRAYYNTQFERLKDNVFPCKPYVEWKLEQFENGELLCERMVDITPVSSMEQGPNDGSSIPAGHTYFHQGKLVVKAKQVKVLPPRDSEDFRRYIETLKACWECTRMRNAGKSWIADLEVKDWDDHVKHILNLTPSFLPAPPKKPVRKISIGSLLSK